MALETNVLLRGVFDREYFMAVERELDVSNAYL